MRVLFIGGTGIISAACTRLAANAESISRSLTRGSASATCPGRCSKPSTPISTSAPSARRSQTRFDAVVDWIAFTPEDIERDLELFAGRTRPVRLHQLGQRVPEAARPITGSPNRPRWRTRTGHYSRNKIACEERLLRAYREEGFPITIVRPSLTYGETRCRSPSTAGRSPTP